MHASITLLRIMALVATDDQRGLCTQCGHDVLQIPPRAIRWDCPHCQAAAVYGWAELLAMDLPQDLINGNQ